MTRFIEFQVNGSPVEAAAGATVAAALLNAGITGFRTSVSGEPRAPLCAMGTCHECRVTIDDQPGQRACLVLVRSGMQVRTGG